MSHYYLGIDVGGSAIKQAVVRVVDGTLLGDMQTLTTPQPSVPDAVLVAIAAACAPAQRPGGATPVRAAGLAFPAVVQQGRARTAAHVDPSWLGVDGAAELQRRLGIPAVFLNDADAAGLAEMRLGAGRGLRGVVIVLTFGTGIGTAPFVDGHLLPNTELGHLPMHGSDGEEWASARARSRDSLGFAAWAERVNEYLDLMQRLFWPDVFIIGGGVSAQFEQFGALLRSPARILPARFRDQAGVIGAALAASEAFALT
jgi:polyphosphate glucokinase